MDTISGMPLELHESYARAMPLIAHALDDALPPTCDTAWLSKVTRGVGQHWDLAVVQETIFEPFAHLLKHGGKRLRPFVTYLVLQAYGRDPRHYMAALASSEFAHVASLICDDVADNSGLRRGIPTVHTVFGLPVAVNVAFTMINYAALLIEQANYDIPTWVRAQLHRMMNQAILSSVVGMAGDVTWSWDAHKPVSEAQIWQHMINRTAPLTFMVPAMVGALLVCAPERARLGIAQWATYTGAIYQLVDDILNLRPQVPTWGKEWAEDLDGRKMTVPVLYALQHLEAEDHARFEKLFNQTVLTGEDKASLISLIDKAGAFAYMSQRIQFLVDSAIQSLADVDLPAENIEPLKAFTESLAKRQL